MNVIAPNRPIIEESSSSDGKKSTRTVKRRKRAEKIRTAGSKFRDAGGVTFLENILLGNTQQQQPNEDLGQPNQNLGTDTSTPPRAPMKTSTKILIGVAVAGVLGFIIYKVVKSKSPKGKSTPKAVK